MVCDIGFVKNHVVSQNRCPVTGSLCTGSSNFSSFGFELVAVHEVDLCVLGVCIPPVRNKKAKDRISVLNTLKTSHSVGIV